jgi:hypothetical protein
MNITHVNLNKSEIERV